MFFFFFKQKTAYEMRISDWSSDVCSSDLVTGTGFEQPLPSPRLRSRHPGRQLLGGLGAAARPRDAAAGGRGRLRGGGDRRRLHRPDRCAQPGGGARRRRDGAGCRSEEHTSELQSLMRISYAVFCLKKKKQ